MNLLQVGQIVLSLDWLLHQFKRADKGQGSFRSVELGLVIYAESIAQHSGGSVEIGILSVDWILRHGR
ncbi:hypothetical protein LMG26846_03612 [Achromobacter insuavis]|uniref:hypothetical protein n=1 Tax=Achromobacter insuavis TaxID=1287735 RepID=UPI0014667C8B|nr:hypothetical protein [Achromobacter insuavis]CAB3883206.1 hypothetical protein LMG26846_03612 [Achromobacter insuavis]